MYTEKIKKRRVNISDLFGVKYNKRTGVVCYIWASVCDFGTYRVSEQRKLRRFCAYAQTRQSLRSLHTKY